MSLHPAQSGTQGPAPRALRNDLPPSQGQRFSCLGLPYHPPWEEKEEELRILAFRMNARARKPPLSLSPARAGVPLHSYANLSLWISGVITASVRLPLQLSPAH